MATDHNLPAQHRANTIRTLFESPQVKNQIAKALPKHLPVDRLLRVAMTAIRTNPKLMECTQESLLACIMGCAQLGLEPEPFLGQAYLVPYWNKKKNLFEAQLIPGYRGYIALARRTGEVQSVSAQVVHQNDTFELEYGLDERLRHVPADGDRGDPKGAYVVVKYKDGSHSMDYMPREDIERIRDRSQAKDSGPWTTDWNEMAKKTVIKRHFKIVPLSVDIARMSAADDMHHAGESQINLFTGEQEAITAEVIRGSEEADMESLRRFASLVEDKTAGNLTAARESRLSEFIRAAAAGNKCSENDIKAQAVDQFDEFWRTFEAWEAKGDNGKGARPNKEEPSHKTKRQQEKPVEPAPQAPVHETVTCPMTSATVRVGVECSDCSNRDGCPEL